MLYEFMSEEKDHQKKGHQTIDFKIEIPLNIFEWKEEEEVKEMKNFLLFYITSLNLHLTYRMKEMKENEEIL